LFFKLIQGGKANFFIPEKESDLKTGHPARAPMGQGPGKQDIPRR
jgi:hypothetical protein